MFGINFGKKPVVTQPVVQEAPVETKPANTSTLWNKKTVAYVGGGVATIALAVAAYVYKDALFGGAQN